MSDYIQCERCDFNKGDVVDNNFKVTKKLGEGTFGMVYKVEDYQGNTYALKLLKLWQVMASERHQLLQRFTMEYETGKIDSNYLVHSYCTGTVSGNPYILMEFCPGGDLVHAAEKGTVDFVQAGCEILYGLGDLHRCGKVHRDLKPENVLLRTDGTAVLTDFGISGDQNKRATERDIFGNPTQIFGTWAYMPPEQVKPKRGNATVLPTTDIFSYGVMMYQLLTNAMPFGELNKIADLVAYQQNGATGNWNRDKLYHTTGNSWMPMMEGCLHPDYRYRLQNVNAVLSVMPASQAQTYRPVETPQGAANFSRTASNGLQLRIMQGEDYGKVYSLESFIAQKRGVVTMGRADRLVENAIPITEQNSCYVSRCHCTLEYDRTRKVWSIRDGQWRPDYSGKYAWKASTNGTYLNSTEVGCYHGIDLQPGDMISIGDVKIRVEGA